MRSMVLAVILALAMISSAAAIDIEVKLSGPGAVNDSTIKAGEKVSFDIMMKNDGNFKGFSMGFKLLSDNMKTIIHPESDTTGLGKDGDVSAYNEWETKLLWSLGGLFVVKRDWDGTFPELIGFGGISMKKEYAPHEWQKNISIHAIFDETGTFTLDSSFYPPKGDWIFVPPETNPGWGGPYHYTVVK